MSSIANLLILLPARIASYFSWAGPLLMRLIVGYVFMLTGWGKLANLAQVTENFIGWGIPFPKILTPFVSGVEFFGGAMLILGLFTRPRRDAGGGDGRRDQLEMGRRRLAGDPARLRGSDLLAAFIWLAIAGPGRHQWIGCC
jgi:putative oxidoreductase